jgi:hypothetical protein
MKKIFYYENCIKNIEDYFNIYFYGIIRKQFLKAGIISIINKNIKPTKSSAKDYLVNSEYDFPVGTKFKYKGKKYKVVEEKTCFRCGFFDLKGSCIKSFIFCERLIRKDRTAVIFQEIK